MKRTGRILAAGGILLAAATIITLGVKMGSASPVNIALSSPRWKRPVMGRMYSFGQWSLPGETPTSVAQAVSTINPTFVSGLIRIEGPSSSSGNGLPLSAQEIADFGTVRSLVPGALFDVWFRPTQGYTAATLTAAIQQLLSQLNADVLSFDVFDAITPDLQAAIVDTCASSGVLSLGDVGSNTYVPLSVMPDVVTTYDWPSVPGGGPVSLSAVGFMFGAQMPQLAAAVNGAGVPLLLHVNNGPFPVDTAGNPEHYQFGSMLSSAERQAFYLTAAQAQAYSGFAVMYGTEWPVISVGPPSSYYNAALDDGTLAYLASLAATFNA